MARKKAVFPTTVFLRQEESGGEKYFVVEGKAENTADLSQDVEVAEYRLVRKLRVRANVTIEAVGRPL